MGCRLGASTAQFLPLKAPWAELRLQRELQLISIPRTHVVKTGEASLSLVSGPTTPPLWNIILNPLIDQQASESHERLLYIWAGLARSAL